MKKINSLKLSSREKVLFFFSGILILSFLCWLLGLFIGGENSSQMGLFAFNMQDFFADSSNTAAYCAFKSPYDNECYCGLQDKQYPPLPYIIFYLYARLSGMMQQYYEANYFRGMYMEHLYLFVLIVFMMVSVLFIFEAVRYCVNGSNILKVLVGLAMLGSFPVLYTLERANVIIFAIGFLFVFLFGYESENKVVREIAYICIAIAAGLKLTPCIFGILILYKHRWADAFRTIIYGLALIFLPFLFFHGGFHNIPLWIRNIQLSSQFYTPLDGSGLIACFADLFAQFGKDISLLGMPVLLAINCVVCILLLIIAYFAPKKWEQVLAVSIVVLAAPGRSGDYDTLYLLPFMVMFFNEEKYNWRDAIVFAAIFMMLHCYRSVYQAKFVNHHGALIILTGYMLARGVVIAMEKYKTRNKGKNSNLVSYV